MKKLHLIFAVMMFFVITSCAEDSSSNGNSDNTGYVKCPITADNFTFETTDQLNYQLKLMAEYQDNAVVRWQTNFGTEYDSIEPLISYNSVSSYKEITFYYNTNKCGSIVLTPDIEEPVTVYGKPEICDDFKYSLEHYMEQGSNYYHIGKLKITPVFSDKNALVTTKFLIEYKNPNDIYTGIDDITWLIGNKEYKGVTNEIDFEVFSADEDQNGVLNGDFSILNLTIKDVNGIDSCSYNSKSIKLYDQVGTNSSSITTENNWFIGDDGLRKCNYIVNVFDADFPLDITVTFPDEQKFTVDNAVYNEYPFTLNALFDDTSSYCRENPDDDICYSCSSAGVSLIVKNINKNFHFTEYFER